MKHDCHMDPIDFIIKCIDNAAQWMHITRLSIRDHMKIDASLHLINDMQHYFQEYKDGSVYLKINECSPNLSILAKCIESYD